MLKNLNTYGSERATVFGNSGETWMTSFVNNLLAKVISINNIYNSLTNN